MTEHRLQARLWSLHPYSKPSGKWLQVGLFEQKGGQDELQRSLPPQPFCDFVSDSVKPCSSSVRDSKVPTTMCSGTFSTTKEIETSMDNICQCLAFLIVKNCFLGMHWNFMNFNLCHISAMPGWGTLLRSIWLSLLHSLTALTKSLLNLLFSRLIIPALSAFPYWRKAPDP